MSFVSPPPFSAMSSEVCSSDKPDLVNNDVPGADPHQVGDILIKVRTVLKQTGG